MTLLVSTEVGTHGRLLCPHHLLRGSTSWSYLGLRKQSGSENRSNKDARMTWQSSPKIHVHPEALSRTKALTTLSSQWLPRPCTAHFTRLLFPVSYLKGRHPPTHHLPLFFPHSFSVPGSNNDSRKVTFAALPLATPVLPAEPQHLNSMLCWHLHPNASPPT